MKFYFENIEWNLFEYFINSVQDFNTELINMI